MDPSLLIAVALASLVGVLMSLLGGGGSILTIPVLLYALGMEPHPAIAASLVVVGATSVAALIPHARAKHVRWGKGLVFGATSMLGAFAVGRVAHLIPGGIRVLAFGVVMVISAIAMMRPRREALASAGDRSASAARVRGIVEGLLVGGLTGLVGAGGGFIIVPALVLLGGLSMRDAIGTSLLVIAMNSVAALGGQLGAVDLDLGVTAAVSAAAVVGTQLGGPLSGRIPQGILRRGFAWFVIVMAVFLLSQEIPKLFGVALSLRSDGPWIGALIAIALVAAAMDLLRLHRTPTPTAPR